MPYFVKVGTVISGSNVYTVGEALPPGVGDAAMREAGSVEWREPKKAEPQKPKPHAKLRRVK